MTLSKGFLYPPPARMESLIGFGIVMGIAFAVPPGIVTAETFRRGVARGFGAALGVQLGSLIGDAAYCLLALAGVAVLVQNPLTQRALGLVSVGLLLYLAVTGILSELRSSGGGSGLPGREPVAADPVQGRVSRNNPFLTGLLLSLTNPWAIGFWLSLGGTLAAFGALESGGTMALFFTGFFGACLVYAFVLAVLIGVAHKAIPPAAGKYISIACSLLIGILGIGVAVQVLNLFLNG